MKNLRNISTFRTTIRMDTRKNLGNTTNNEEKSIPPRATAARRQLVRPNRLISFLQSRTGGGESASSSTTTTTSTFSTERKKQDDNVVVAETTIARRSDCSADAPRRREKGTSSLTSLGKRRIQTMFSELDAQSNVSTDDEDETSSSSSSSSEKRGVSFTSSDKTGVSKKNVSASRPSSLSRPFVRPRSVTFSGDRSSCSSAEENIIATTRTTQTRGVDEERFSSSGDDDSHSSSSGSNGRSYIHEPEANSPVVTESHPTDSATPLAILKRAQQIGIMTPLVYRGPSGRRSIGTTRTLGSESSSLSSRHANASTDESSDAFTDEGRAATVEPNSKEESFKLVEPNPYSSEEEDADYFHAIHDVIFSSDEEAEIDENAFDFLVPARRKYVHSNRSVSESTRLRRERREENLKFRANTLDIDEGDLLTSVCCKRRQCYLKVRIDLIRTIRARFYANDMTRTDRFVYLQKLIRMSLIDFHSLSLVEGVAETKCCQKFFCRVYHISNTLFYKAKDVAHSKGAFRNQRNLVFGSTKREEIVAFLEMTARAGDIMPHRPHVMLPYRRKYQAYEAYMSRCRNSDDIPASSQYFYRVWARDVKHIKCRRTHDFAACELCDNIQRNLVNANNMHRHNELVRNLSDHLELIFKLRTQYHLRKDMARQDPHNIMSVCIDGSSQECYRLPHLVQSTKATSSAHKSGVHLLGAINHGFSQNYCYTQLENKYQNTNVTIEVLRRVMLHTRTLTPDGSLPRTLYVQLDNCGRDNKNKYFIAWLAHLVDSRIFSVVEINFLPVGHTHIDVDQMFSRISMHLRYHDMLTLDELEDHCGMATTPSPNVERLHNIANVIGLLEMDKTFNVFRGISRPLAFRLAFDPVAQRVGFWTKQHCLIADWQAGSGGETISSFPILRRPLFLHKVPPYVPKDIAEIIVEMQNGLNKIVRKKPDLFSESQLTDLMDMHLSMANPELSDFHWRTDEVYYFRKFLTDWEAVFENDEMLLSSFRNDFLRLQNSIPADALETPTLYIAPENIPAIDTTKDDDVERRLRDPLNDIPLTLTDTSDQIFLQRRSQVGQKLNTLNCDHVKVNYYVCVFTDWNVSQEVALWTGRVVRLIPKERRLSIHLYSNRQGRLTGKHTPDFLRSGGPLLHECHADDVIIAFEQLSSGGTLFQSVIAATQKDPRVIEKLGELASLPNDDDSPDEEAIGAPPSPTRRLRRPRTTRKQAAETKVTEHNSSDSPYEPEERSVGGKRTRVGRSTSKRGRKARQGTKKKKERRQAYIRRKKVNKSSSSDSPDNVMMQYSGGDSDESSE